MKFSFHLYVWVCGCVYTKMEPKKREERKEKERWKLINEPVISFCLLESLVFSFACFNRPREKVKKKKTKENMVGILYNFFCTHKLLLNKMFFVFFFFRWFTIFFPTLYFSSFHFIYCRSHWVCSSFPNWCGFCCIYTTRSCKLFSLPLPLV